MRRNSVIYLFVLIAMLYACEEREEEVVSLEDILPSSDRYNQEQETLNDVSEVDSTLSMRNDFVEHGIQVDSLTYLTKRIFPERFGPYFVHKFELRSETDNIRFYQLNFSDSVKTNNAFFNWMDCFGEECDAHFIGEEANFQKDAFFLSMNDTSLFFVTSTGVLDTKKWLEYFEKKEFTPEWNYFIEQRKRGKTKWYRFVEGKKEKIDSKSE